MCGRPENWQQLERPEQSLLRVSSPGNVPANPVGLIHFSPHAQYTVRMNTADVALSARSTGGKRHKPDENGFSTT